MKSSQNIPRTLFICLGGALAGIRASLAGQEPSSIDNDLSVIEEVGKELLKMSDAMAEQGATEDLLSEGAPEGDGTVKADPSPLSLRLDADPVFGILGTRNVNVLWSYAPYDLDNWKGRDSTVGDLLARSDKELMRVRHFGAKGVERVAKLRAWVDEQGAEQEGPSANEMLEWACENVCEFRKVRGKVRVIWIDGTLQTRSKYGTDWRDAITKAMGEAKAGVAGVASGA